MLTDVVPAGTRLEAVVVAAAGAGPPGRHRALDAARTATAAHLVGTLLVHSDIEAAFAAGSAAPDGTVLIAGTGAVAAAVRDFGVRRRQDGHGYLLGDRGSAFWIGSRAARAALAALDGTGEPTALGPARERLRPSRRRGRGARRRSRPTPRPSRRLSTRTRRPGSARSRRWWNLLRTSGDSVARRHLDAAVEALVATAAAVDEGGPLVVTGGVAAGPGTLGRTPSGPLDGAAGTHRR